MTTVTIRDRQANVLIRGQVLQEGWQETATRLYNRYLRSQRIPNSPRLQKRYLATCQPFPGGGTYHVQFGIWLGGSQTTLDELVVIQVE